MSQTSVGVPPRNARYASRTRAARSQPVEEDPQAPLSPATQMRIGPRVPGGGAVVKTCSASPPARISRRVPTA